MEVTLHKPIDVRFARIEKRIESLEASKPDHKLDWPSVVVLFKNPQRGRAEYRVESRGEVSKYVERCADNISCRIYRTHAGGSWRVVVVLVNGEKEVGPANLSHLSILINGEIADQHTQRFTVVPGGRRAVSFFVGSPEAYCTARFKQQSAPLWADEKLGAPWILPRIGPYEVCWSPLGWAKGGQGASLHFADWRRRPKGQIQMLRELDAAGNRNACAYLDQSGEPLYWSHPQFSLTLGFNTPQGYNFDIDTVARWWPSIYEFMSYQKNDGQHFYRAWRTAVEFMDDDPWAADQAAWYWNHVRLAWEPDDASDNLPPYFWTAKQLCDYLSNNRGPSPALGREIAWVAALAYQMDPHGRLAEYLDRIFFLAAERKGICYLTTNSNELGGSVGAYHPDSPWEVGDPVAQTFQWSLLIESLKLRKDDSDIQNIVRRFEGSTPSQMLWYGDDKDTLYGGTVPFMHLYRGKFLPGQNAIDVYNEGALRGVEAHGAQIWNYWDRRYWENDPNLRDLLV